MVSSTYISWRLKRVESHRRQRNTIVSFSLFHHVFLFFFFNVLYNIIRSDRVYWGLIGWKWCHLLKLRPRSRSFFVVFKYREERRSEGEVERWRRRRRRSVTLIVCRVHPSLRPYDRPTPRRYDVIGKDVEC